MKTIAAAALAGIVALTTVGTTSYLTGKRAGAAAERADWVERERVRVEAVAAARLDDMRQLQVLQTEIEALRARPEAVRGVAEGIHVAPDDDCSGLPDAWRLLFNAGAGADPAAAASTVDDGRMP